VYKRQVNVLLNDSDINGVGDSLKVTAVGMTAVNGLVTIVGDSSISYTPPLNYDSVDSVQYTVCDTSMGCSTAWVFFTLNPVNDKPIANMDSIALMKDTSNALIAVKENDTDIDFDILTVDTIGKSTQGQTVTVQNDSILYSAPPGFIGVDTVTYEVSDGFLTDTALLKIVISDPNNIAPIANTDFATTTPTVTIVVDVQSNDMDGNGDDLVTSIVSGPNGLNTATVLNNDSIQYTSIKQFVGIDTIIYQVCDPSLACDSDTLFVNVTNKVAVSAIVLLEGPFSPTSGLMHDSLRRQN